MITTGQSRKVRIAKLTDAELERLVRAHQDGSSFAESLIVEWHRRRRLGRRSESHGTWQSHPAFRRYSPEGGIAFEGLAAPRGCDFVLDDGTTYTFLPGAWRDPCRLHNAVDCRIGHDGSPLGDVENGLLKLWEDSYGLRFSLRLESALLGRDGVRDLISKSVGGEFVGVSIAWHPKLSTSESGYAHAKRGGSWQDFQHFVVSDAGALDHIAILPSPQVPRVAGTWVRLAVRDADELAEYGYGYHHLDWRREKIIEI
jgi:Caudovirus prohead serine protease